MTLGYAYISFSKNDLAIKNRLQIILNGSGIITWMAPAGEPEEKQYASLVARAIGNCACFILVLSRSAQDSFFIAKDLEKAVKLGKPVIPVRIDDVTPNEKFAALLGGARIITIREPDKGSEEIRELLAAVTSFTSADLSFGAGRKTDPSAGPSDEPPYIFISYNHKDAAEVLPLISRLQQDGYSVWYDRGIETGKEWAKVIADHIDCCAFVIAFMSGNYLQSENCLDELDLFREKNKPRALAYLERVEEPTYIMLRHGRFQKVFRDDYLTPDAFLGKLCTAPEIRKCKKAVSY